MWIHLTNAEAAQIKDLIKTHQLFADLEAKVKEAEADAVKFRDAVGAAVIHYQGNPTNYPDGEIQIDSADCAVSDADKGVWVQGWLFVPIGSS